MLRISQHPQQFQEVRSQRGVEGGDHCGVEGVVDLDVAGPIGGDPAHPWAWPIELVDQVGFGRGRRRRDAVGGGECQHVGAERGSEELLESIGCERRRLGQEREDATAVVVDDDHPQIRLACHQADQCVGVVDEGQVTDQHDRRGSGERPTERGRQHAVDAVRSTVGVSAGARPTEPFEVADRHRRGDGQLGVR